MPIQFELSNIHANVQADYGFVGNGIPEKDIFYFHSDHLSHGFYF